MSKRRIGLDSARTMDWRLLHGCLPARLDTLQPHWIKERRDIHNIPMPSFNTLHVCYIFFTMAWGDCCFKVKQHIQLIPSSQEVMWDIQDLKFMGYYYKQLSGTIMIQGQKIYRICSVLKTCQLIQEFILTSLVPMFYCQKAFLICTVFLKLP